MTNKQKICAAGAAILGFLGLIATPVCGMLPAPWQSVCVLAGKSAEIGSQEINKDLAKSFDAGR